MRNTVRKESIYRDLSVDRSKIGCSGRSDVGGRVRARECREGLDEAKEKERNEHVLRLGLC